MCSEKSSIVIETCIWSKKYTKFSGPSWKKKNYISDKQTSNLKSNFHTHYYKIEYFGSCRISQCCVVEIFSDDAVLLLGTLTSLFPRGAREAIQDNGREACHWTELHLHTELGRPENIDEIRSEFHHLPMS